jgi:hypothetical protein
LKFIALYLESYKKQQNCKNIHWSLTNIISKVLTAFYTCYFNAKKVKCPPLLIANQSARITRNTLYWWCWFVAAFVFFLSVQIIYEVYTDAVVYIPPGNPFVTFVIHLQQMGCNFHVGILRKPKRVLCRFMDNVSTELIYWLY